MKVVEEKKLTKPVEEKVEVLRSNKATVQPTTSSKQPTVTGKQITQFSKPVITVPEILRKRENKLAQQIETPGAVISIELYDNGEIDADTVSIYLNNERIIHRGDFE